MTGAVGEETNTEGPLAGISVLVTRPADQAEPFCRLIEARGGTAVRFPVLEILDPEDAGEILAQVDRLGQFDMAIFISPNAVAKAMNIIHARGGMPQALEVAAIGKKSASELERYGHPATIRPGRRFDSEALLAMPEMQDVVGRSIMIFRGDGGREVLGDTLRERGAYVEYANAYRRAKPNADISGLMHRWSREGIDVVTITSVEGLRNLFDMVGKLGQMWLRKTPLVVGSQRMREAAEEMGFKQAPVVAADPTDEAMMEAVLEWARER